MAFTWSSTVDLWIGCCILSTKTQRKYHCETVHITALCSFKHEFNLMSERFMFVSLH